MQPQRTKIAALALAAAVAMIAAPSVLAAKDEPGRGYLGVSLQFTELLHREGHPVAEQTGLVVSGVFPGSGAEAAGLQEQDKIVAIDGQAIRDLHALAAALGSRREGDRVSLTVERDGRERDFDLILGAKPPERRLNVERFGMALDDPADRAFVGIETQPLGPQLARYFGVEGGVLVASVVDEAPARQAGIEAGDVIVAWDEAPIRTVHDLHRAISGAKPGDRIQLEVFRRGAASRLDVTLGESRGLMEHREALHRLHRENVPFGEHPDHGFGVRVIERKGGGE